MHRVPVQSTLMAAVKLQKCVIVSRCKTPHQFDIPCFYWFCHLPRLDVSPALTYELPFPAGGVPLSWHDCHRIQLVKRALVYSSRCCDALRCRRLAHRWKRLRRLLRCLQSEETYSRNIPVKQHDIHWGGEDHARQIPTQDSGCNLDLPLAAGLIFMAGVQAQNSGGAPQMLKGEGSFNDWTNERPGNRYLIKASDLPKPYATDSAPNQSKVVPRPADAWPKVPDGFKIDQALTGLESRARLSPRRTETCSWRKALRAAFASSAGLAATARSTRTRCSPPA